MYCLLAYVERIYELSLKLKRTIACVYVSFLAKYMSIIDNFVIGGGYFDFLYNHWRIKMETIFFVALLAVY